MKLELKHLAPYLPYGLKIAYRDIIDHEEDDEFIMSADAIEIVLNETEYIPILRPISDLDKEVNSFLSFPYCDYIIEEEDEFSLFQEDGLVYITDKCELNLFEVTRIQSIINKLYEQHFDVFGLIDKGLALDINTLNK